MPTVLQDLKASEPTVAALKNSIATFTLIASGIRTEINEFTSNTYGAGKTLRDWGLEIFDGGYENNWIADRTRFLNATVTFPIRYSLTTVATGYNATYPTGNLFGNRQSFSGNLGGLLTDNPGSVWTIIQGLSGHQLANPGLLPGSAYEGIQVYSSSSKILSATRLVPFEEIYTKDRYRFYLNDKTFRFVCSYLNETPLNVARGDQCRGLIYSLSSIEIGTTSMTNQITFEESKREELSRLF